MERNRFEQLLEYLFRIRKGEFEKTFLMFLYSFNAVAVFIIGRIMKDTLFLSKSDLSLLPYMYVAVGTAVGVVMYVYSRVAGRTPLKISVNIALGAFLLLLQVFRLLLELKDNFWTVPALYVFVEIMGIVLVIQFWTFANEIFNSREAKRLFGLIGAGAVTANLYSFPVRDIAQVIGIKNLSFVCSLSLLLCIVIFNYLAKKHLGRSSGARQSVPLREEIEEKIPQARQHVYKTLRHSMVAMTIITILAVTFVDYQFKVIAKHSFEGPALGQFFFNLYAYGGLLACAVQLFATGRMLDRFGILPALVILPVMLMTGSAISLAWLGIVGVTITKGSELVIRYTVYEATTNLLYQPLPAIERRRLKAVSDGLARPAAQVAAGLLFIALNAAFAINRPDRIGLLAWFVLVMGLLWVAVVVVARRKYVDALLIGGDRQARAGWEKTENEDLLASLPKAAIRRALESGDEIQIRNAIEMLPPGRIHEWEESLVALLECPFASVRIESMRVLAASGNRKFSRFILNRFDDHDDEVSAQAIRLFCSLERERAVTLIAGRMQSPVAQVKAAAIAGLIRYGGLEGMMSSVGALKTMLDASNPQERETGARVLGFIKIESFYQPLLKLINDPEIRVQRAAIEAAGELKAEELIPSLIYKLLSPETRMPAASALASFGQAAIRSLREVLDLHHIDMKLGREIAVVLGMLGGDEAVEMLSELAASRDEHMRSAAARALQRIFARGGAEKGIDPTHVRDVLHTDLEHYYQILLDLQTIRRDLNSPLLETALLDRLDKTIIRIFMLLSLIYPPRRIEVIQYNIKSENIAMRSNAVEVIDNILEAETRRYLMPIFDSISENDKLARGGEFFQLQKHDAVELLENYLKDSCDWLQVCAVYTIGLRGISAMKNELPRLLESSDPVVRETTLYTLARLDGGNGLAAATRKLGGEKDTIVREYLLSLSPA